MYPRKGNQFIMQVLIKMGYTDKMLLHLNCLWVFHQVLFMSDILTASGHKINLEVLSRQPPDEAQSSMGWPTEQPTDLDLHLWRNAILSICPSCSRTPQVGCFMASTHKIWHWTWSEEEATLHHLHKEGITEDVFVSGKRLNCYNYSYSQPANKHNMICSVEPTLGNGSWHLTYSVPHTNPVPAPESFLEVLQSLGNTWLWGHRK
jgi:hypothetical protein